MRIELVSFDGETAFLEYDNFSLAAEHYKYKLKVYVLIGCFIRLVCSFVSMFSRVRLVANL